MYTKINLRNNKETRRIIVALHAIKICVIMEVELHLFFTSALNWMDWSLTRTDCFDSHWYPVSRMQGSRAGFKALDNRIIYCKCRDSTHDLSDGDSILIYMFGAHGIIIKLFFYNVLKEIYTLRF